MMLLNEEDEFTVEKIHLSWRDVVIVVCACVSCINCMCVCVDELLDQRECTVFSMIK